MVRPSGTEAPGARRCGQADQFDELRARVSPTCAELGVWRRQIKALDEKSSLHFSWEVELGAESEDRGLVIWNAHALGQADAEAVEERGLGGVGLGDATQSDLAVRCGRQDDVVGLDAGKLFEDGPRRVAEARALLPHLEALPQHEREKANEDVGLDPLLALMPDRPNVQLIFLDAKSRFGLGELDVSLPELMIGPIVMFERRR